MILFGSRSKVVRRRRGIYLIAMRCGSSTSLRCLGFFWLLAFRWPSWCEGVFLTQLKVVADGTQSHVMGSTCTRLGHLDLLDLLCSVIGGQIQCWRCFTCVRHVWLCGDVDCHTPFLGCVFEVRSTKSLAEAQQTVLLTNRASNLQEWHGLTMGLRWMPPDENDPHFDPYRRPVKDRPLCMKRNWLTDGEFWSTAVWFPAPGLGLC